MRTIAEVAGQAARVATGRLGWSPDRFWNTTIAEFILVLEGMLGRAAAQPLGRGELQELMEKMGDGRR